MSARKSTMHGSCSVPCYIREPSIVESDDELEESSEETLSSCVELNTNTLPGTSEEKGLEVKPWSLRIAFLTQMSSTLNITHRLHRLMDVTEWFEQLVDGEKLEDIFKVADKSENHHETEAVMWRAIRAKTKGLSAACKKMAYLGLGMMRTMQAFVRGDDGSFLLDIALNSLEFDVYDVSQLRDNMDLWDLSVDTLEQILSPSGPPAIVKKNASLLRMLECGQKLFENLAHVYKDQMVLLQDLQIKNDIIKKTKDYQLKTEIVQRQIQGISVELRDLQNIQLPKGLQQLKQVAEEQILLKLEVREGLVRETVEPPSAQIPTAPPEKVRSMRKSVQESHKEYQETVFAELDKLREAYVEQRSPPQQSVKESYTDETMQRGLPQVVKESYTDETMQRGLPQVGMEESDADETMQGSFPEIVVEESYSDETMQDGLSQAVVKKSPRDETVSILSEELAQESYTDATIQRILSDESLKGASEKDISILRRLYKELEKFQHLSGLLDEELFRSKLFVQRLEELYAQRAAAVPSPGSAAHPALSPSPRSQKSPLGTPRGKWTYLSAALLGFPTSRSSTTMSSLTLLSSASALSDYIQPKVGPELFNKLRSEAVLNLKKEGIDLHAPKKPQRRGRVPFRSSRKISSKSKRKEQMAAGRLPSTPVQGKKSPKPESKARTPINVPVATKYDDREPGSPERCKEHPERPSSKRSGKRGRRGSKRRGKSRSASVKRKAKGAKRRGKDLRQPVKVIVEEVDVEERELTKPVKVRVEEAKGESRDYAELGKRKGKEGAAADVRDASEAVKRVAREEKPGGRGRSDSLATRAGDGTVTVKRTSSEEEPQRRSSAGGVERETEKPRESSGERLCQGFRRLTGRAHSVEEEEEEGSQVTEEEANFVKTGIDSFNMLREMTMVQLIRLDLHDYVTALEDVNCFWEDSACPRHAVLDVGSKIQTEFAEFKKAISCTLDELRRYEAEQEALARENLSIVRHESGIECWREVFTRMKTQEMEISEVIQQIQMLWKMYYKTRNELFQRKRGKAEKLLAVSEEEEGEEQVEEEAFVPTIEDAMPCITPCSVPGPPPQPTSLPKEWKQDMEMAREAFDDGAINYQDYMEQVMVMLKLVTVLHFKIKGLGTSNLDTHLRSTLTARAEGMLRQVREGRHKLEHWRHVQDLEDFASSLDSLTDAERSARLHQEELNLLLSLQLAHQKVKEQLRENMVEMDTIPESLEPLSTILEQSAEVPAEVLEEEEEEEEEEGGGRGGVGSEEEKRERKEEEKGEGKEKERIWEKGEERRIKAGKGGRKGEEKGEREAEEEGEEEVEDRSKHLLTAETAGLLTPSPKPSSELSGSRGSSGQRLRDKKDVASAVYRNAVYLASGKSGGKVDSSLSVVITTSAKQPPVIRSPPMPKLPGIIQLLHDPGDLEEEWDSPLHAMLKTSQMSRAPRPQSPPKIRPRKQDAWCKVSPAPVKEGEERGRVGAEQRAHWTPLPPTPPAKPRQTTPRKLRRPMFSPTPKVPEPSEEPAEDSSRGPRTPSLRYFCGPDFSAGVGHSGGTIVPFPAFFAPEEQVTLIPLVGGPEDTFMRTSHQDGSLQALSLLPAFPDQDSLRIFSPPSPPCSEKAKLVLSPAACRRHQLLQLQSQKEREWKRRDAERGIQPAHVAALKEYVSTLPQGATEEPRLQQQRVAQAVAAVHHQQLKEQAAAPKVSQQPQPAVHSVLAWTHQRNVHPPAKTCQPPARGSLRTKRIKQDMIVDHILQKRQALEKEQVTVKANLSPQRRRGKKQGQGKASTDTRGTLPAQGREGSGQGGGWSLARPFSGRVIPECRLLCLDMQQTWRTAGRTLALMKNKQLKDVVTEPGCQHIWNKFQQACP